MAASNFTTAEKRACILRKLGFRRRVYPRFVQDAKMKADTADREIALMEAILADYPAEEPKRPADPQEDLFDE